MKQTVTQSDFVQAFDDCHRSNNFTIAGRGALFDYLTELEEDTGEEFELDPIAICCDYAEAASAVEMAEDYGYGFEPDLDAIDDDEDGRAEAIEAQALEWLRDRTTVIAFDGGVIIQQF